MATPFLGEIRLFSFNFPPKSWAFCNGQLLPINQNQALFSLLGTNYGGDGQTTFQLPNLQGRTPIHFGAGFTLGEQGGQGAHTLTIAEVPTHTHSLAGTTADASVSIPNGALLARQAPANSFSAAGSAGTMNPATIANVGGSQPHENMQPYLTLNFCIALQGIFPSQN